MNTVLKPLGMGVIVTEHDDGGVLNYSYSLWFPPFKHPAWGDIPSGYRDIPMTYYHRDSNGEVVTEHIGTLVDLCESKAN